MLSYVIRRLLLVVPTLIGITALVFFVIALSPGGIGAVLYSAEFGMRPAERQALREYYNRRYGLDKPAYVQYFRWLNRVSPVGVKEKGEGWPGPWRVGFKAPDMGESFMRQRPVSSLILEALPVTLMLNLVSIPITYGIAVLTGMFAARHRGKWFDVASGTTFIAMWSVPTIWAGVMFIGYFANVEYFKWFPAGGMSGILADAKPFLPAFTGAGGWEPGWLLDRAWHLVLPVVCLSYGNFAYLSKLSRGAILENIRADFVRTARAKGLDERKVLFRHVFANSLIPLITVAAYVLPALIAGSMVVEIIFSIPGMGRLTYEGVNSRDRELFLATTLISGLLGLIGYLLADICYAIADPRVTYE